MHNPTYKYEALNGGWISAFSRAAFDLLSPGGVNNRLSILIYHRVLRQKDTLFPNEVDAVEFERQLSLLKSCMNFISLADAVNGIRCGDLPPRAACVTFDDGYADNAEVALPILQKLGIPATFFVATGFLNGGRMWNDSVIETIRRVSGPLLDLRSLNLGNIKIETTIQRQEAISSLIGALKYLPLHERTERINCICNLAKVKLPADLMMTSAQVSMLHRAGMEIGGHTVSHPILARLSPADALHEISVGKKSLEEIIQKPVRFFAYPNGKPGQDYVLEHVQMVKDLGFEAAVSTAWGVMGANADLYQLPRFTPWDRSAHKFVLRVARNLLTKVRTA